MSAVQLPQALRISTFSQGSRNQLRIEVVLVAVGGEDCQGLFRTALTFKSILHLDSIENDDAGCGVLVYVPVAQLGPQRSVREDRLNIVDDLVNRHFLSEIAGPRRGRRGYARSSVRGL